MRTTLNIEDKLIEKASELTGITEKTTLVKLGLEALIARESARKLAELGGTEQQLKAIPRRRITKLDSEEKEILGSYDRDEWQSVSNLKSESERYQKYAGCDIQER
jgi:hypothetical protein